MAHLKGALVFYEVLNYNFDLFSARKSFIGEKTGKTKVLSAARIRGSPAQLWDPVFGDFFCFRDVCKVILTVFAEIIAMFAFSPIAVNHFEPLSARPPLTHE